MSHKKQDIDFEIKFYEGILKKHPDFIENLAALGDLYTKKGLYKKGLKIDQKLAKKKPHDPIILYNLACSYSLVEDLDKALETLKKAIKCGYEDICYLEKDKDLKNLHKDQRFKRYISQLKKKLSN